MNDPVRDDSGRELLADGGTVGPAPRCGHQLPSNNGCGPHVCNQPLGHPGDHGVSDGAGGEPYVRWPRG